MCILLFLEKSRKKVETFVQSNGMAIGSPLSSVLADTLVVELTNLIN